MFRVKRVNLHLRNDVRMADINIIYEKSTVQLASVGLAQARPNYYAMVGWLVTSGIRTKRGLVSAKICTKCGPVLGS